MLDTLSSKSCDKENMLVHAMQTIKLSTKKKISTREKFIVEVLYTLQYNIIYIVGRANQALTYRKSSFTRST